jgi:exodeoxyribonuclease-3
VPTAAASLRDNPVIGGDHSVIIRTHRPLHAGFLPFEFALLETLEANGSVERHERSSPDGQPDGRTGDGYRYDYFHIGRALMDPLTGSAHSHETRALRLTDHAAVTISIEEAVTLF